MNTFKSFKSLLVASILPIAMNAQADTSVTIPYSALINGELHGFVVTQGSQHTVNYQGPISLDFPNEVPAQAFISFSVKADLISDSYTPVSYVYQNGSASCTFNFNLNRSDSSINVETASTSDKRCDIKLINNLLLLNIALA